MTSCGVFFNLSAGKAFCTQSNYYFRFCFFLLLLSYPINVYCIIFLFICSLAMFYVSRCGFPVVFVRFFPVNQPFSRLTVFSSRGGFSSLRCVSLSLLPVKKKKKKNVFHFLFVFLCLFFPISYRIPILFSFLAVAFAVSYFLSFFFFSFLDFHRLLFFFSWPIFFS